MHTIIISAFLPVTPLSTSLKIKCLSFSITLLPIFIPTFSKVTKSATKVCTFNNQIINNKWFVTEFDLLQNKMVYVLVLKFNQCNS